MNDCLFCSIIQKETSASLQFEDDQVVAFDDINPKAPTHIMIVPKKHIASVAELNEGDEQIVGHMVRVAKNLAEELGIAEDGYRLVLNTRTHGGQMIDHIHLHLLGGQKLGGMA